MCIIELSTYWFQGQGCNQRALTFIKFRSINKCKRNQNIFMEY